jgi:hypothetical protein
MQLSKLMKAGKITDIEALADLMDFAAPMYTKTISCGGKGGAIQKQVYDVGGFLNDLGMVAGGIQKLPISNFLSHALHNNIAMNNLWARGDGNVPYYVGYDSFVPNRNKTGFQFNLNPNGDNQVQHFMGGASIADTYGLIGEQYMLATENQQEDIALFYKSFEFVNFLHSGVPLSKASWWVLTNLGN